MNSIDGKLFAFEKIFWDKNLVFDFIKLIQLSDVVLEPQGQIFEHIQECCEISYIISGAAFFYTEDKAMRVEHGNIHVISTNQRHKIIADPHEKLRYICIGFDFERIPEEFRDICSFYDNAPHFTANSEGDIRNLFDMLVNEFYLNPDTDHCAVEFILKLILVKVFRCFTKNEKILSSKRKSGYGNATIYKIVKYIDNNIYNINSVREVASGLNFTENYISHTFKSNMGISLSTYIKKRKVETAKALLENDNMTLTEISDILRFDSVQSLSRAFKEEYGKTTTQYIGAKCRGD